MPRTTKATTADTLEHQAAADSDLEELPDFTMPGPNGHTPEGIRPSERCGTPSPLHISCTFKDEHAGPHSWQPEAGAALLDELAQLRQRDEAEEEFDPERSVMSDDERWDGSVQKSYRLADGTPCDEHGKPLTQPALPGTPEPETNDYTVPTEASFGKAKLMPAHGLRAIGDRLIADDDNLEHLRGVEMRYAWRRRGGTQGGNPRFARIKRPSVWEDFLTGGQVSFMVDVSADHVREFRFSERQIEACIHEQLSRTERDDDDHDAFRINGPDFSGSISTLDKFGAWKPELREMRVHVAKLPLEQAIDDADESEDDEADEG